jgi:ABC-type bacteriocin/lantibiotic exporter with double-glycine peptidase domain
MLFEDRRFTFEAGDRIALYGTQGSGVSSFLDLLFVVRQPTAGHLSFDGIDSRSYHPESLRESVQILRRDEFIDGTIIENLRLGRPGISIEEIRSALERVGLLETCLRHPEGLNQRLRVGGGPLSTSQRISLLIARALVQRPRLLLIDELFDGLDDLTFSRLSHLVLSKEEPWTVVVATRMKEVLAICDRTLALSPLPAPSLATPPRPVDE